MSTLLTRLSGELDALVSPVLELLDDANAHLMALRGADAGDDVERVAARLAGFRESLRTLREKVAEQRSYVLLFGPLKSGKSTLMNALSAAYVSEVTSLPAYPCMVYVRHAPRLEVAVERWDGEVDSFSGLDQMRAHVAGAHADLARALRRAEAAGVDFDPTIHQPHAIRRVDVRMPAPRLLESGTVLVDTPGLYTRMKFGYDQLTREFRLASACAIFVVKTDNLFLEQVFDEFDDLLRLFSRIFLVVNLDTAKRDLEPDGGLGPSLERRDPAQILAAFEELAMSETLRRARDEGRLQIYPIDLLRAASARLRAGAAADTASSDETEKGPEDADATGGVPVDFERFVSDLAAYLASQEALVAFVRDSLQQANDVLAELATVCRGEAAAVAERLVAVAEETRARFGARADAARRLSSRSLEEGCAPHAEDVTSITRERSVDVRKQAADRAEAALDRWFETDRSFAQLVGEDLVEVFAACRDELSTLARDGARTVLASDVAAAGIRRLAPADFDALDLPIARIARSALSGGEAAESGKSALLTIPYGLVPVKRSALDWLLLRGPVRVRKALFGPEEAPTRPVARTVKQRRLGAPARAALGAATRVRLDRFFAEALSQSAVAAFGEAATAVAARLHAAIDEAGRAAGTAMVDMRATLADRATLRSAIDVLGRTAERATADTDRLLDAWGVRTPAPEASGAPAAVAEVGAPGGGATIDEEEPAAPELPVEKD
ncbi:MAG TPA: dynamin family protein [Candidatus Binatia bacterium]|nr:dynamin family protein [Candidatus Binatia bacterium]